MPLSDTDLLATAKARYNLASQFAESWRQDAKRAYDFVAGNQIDPKDEAALRRDNRPVVVFNLIGPNLKAISGMERGNRHEIKTLPREQSQIDGAASEIYNQVIKYIFDRNDNEFFESKAFRDMTITGMGWSQTFIDDLEDPEGMIYTPTIDPLRKLWDPSAKAENLSDRRYDFTEVLLDKDEFIALGEEFEAFEKAHKLEAKVFGGTIEDPLDFTKIIETKPDQYAGEGNEFDFERYLGKVAVLEYNFYIFEQIYQFINEDGSPGNEFAGKDKADTLRREFGDDRVIPLGKQRRYYKAWFNGDSLIHQQLNADPKAFTEYCITGEYDRNKGHWFGVVRAMEDPQAWSNKLFMQLLHIINSNAKGGFFFRSGVFTNKLKALRDWAKGDRGIEVKGNDPINAMIQERSPTPMPTAMHELMMFVVGIIPRVSGFNMELLGLAGKDQPGVLEHMRKQAGMTILAPFFDSLRFYRKQKGRGLIHFIRTYMSQEKIARIVDDRARENLAVLDLPGVEKFDILVEESPHSPNIKSSNFIMLGEFLQTQPELAGLIGDLILEQSPLPTSLVSAISERMQQARQPDPMAQRAQIAQIVREEMAAFKDQTAAVLNLAKAGTEQSKPELEQDKLDVSAAKESMEFVSSMAQTKASVEKSNQKASND